MATNKERTEGSFIEESYLGDGLYARDDGYQIWLRTPRIEGDHEVALEDGVLHAFFSFVERKRGIKITVTRPAGPPPPDELF